jgi:hypothetical protein
VTRLCYKGASPPCSYSSPVLLLHPVVVGNLLKCSRLSQTKGRRSRARSLPGSTHTGRRTGQALGRTAGALGTLMSTLTHPLSALFVSLSDLQRPPFSLPGTVAPLQGPPFPPPCNLQPLRFCSTAQLPRTRLSLQGPLLPSGSLAACSLLSQVAFIGLSLGVGALLFPWKQENFQGNWAARAGPCKPSLSCSIRPSHIFWLSSPKKLYF